MMKTITTVLALFVCVGFPLAAQADPTVVPRLLGFNNSGNRLWSVQIDPDESLFQTHPVSGELGGSLAVELAFDVDSSDLVDVSVNSVDWSTELPGNNPFTNTVTEGLWVNELTGQFMLFAAYGSEFLTSGDPVELLSFETLGSAKTTLTWGEEATGEPLEGAIIAQAAQTFYDSGMFMSAPEPGSMVLVGIALAAVAMIRRTRTP